MGTRTPGRRHRHLGRSAAFDDAIGRFALAYADITEVDHHALAEAITAGTVEAAAG